MSSIVSVQNTSEIGLKCFSGRALYRLYQSSALSLVLAASLLAGTAVAQHADDVVQLRGSSAIVDTHEEIELRSSTVPNDIVYEEVIVEETRTDPDSTYDESSFLSDSKNALKHFRTNIIPTFSFRGPKAALSDRNISYFVPSRSSLRHSMMHEANLYEGLRSGEAGVGDTVAQSLRGSYSARASLAKADADRSSLHGSLLNFLPRVSGIVNASLTPKDSAASFNNNTSEASVGVELSLPLFTSGANLNTYRQAKHLSLASDHDYLAEEHRVALEAIAAHVNLRLNRRIERALQKNVKAVQRVAHIARKLYEAGDASRTDIAIAQANVESARAEVDLARKTREETLADYESLTGQPAPSGLKRSNFESLVPESLEAAQDMALARNPRLASSMHTALASKYAAKAERGRFGPRVDLFGNYNKDIHSSSRNSDSQDWNIGVRLRVPLFDATSTSSVMTARHTAIEAQFRSLDQARLIERQVRRQWSAYHSAARRVGIVQRQVRAIATSVEGARREYQAGFRSISDVLNDQLRLARAQITLESAKHEQMLAAYELAFTTAHPAIRHIASGQ